MAGSVRRLSAGRLLAGLLGLLLASAACASTPPPYTPPPAVLRVGLPLPSVTSSSIGTRVVAWILAGGLLLRTDDEGRHHSDIAVGWDVADDGLALTFRLHPAARFADGERLTATSVKAFLDAVLQDPGQLAPYPALRDITAVEAHGTDTVVLRLSEPSGLLLSNLDFPVTKRAEDGREIGAGPFVIESESADLTVLRVNPYHHGGQSRVSTIHLRSFETVRAAWAAMMRGEIDFLYQVPNDTREFLERESGVRMQPVLRRSVFSLVFNMRRPMFRPAEVRAALSEAVDRQQIVDLALRGHGEPATGYLWPHHWARRPDTPSFGYSPRRSLAALEDRAADPEQGRMRGAKLRFRCLVPAGVSPHDRVAIVLQKQLFDIGVDMQIEPVPIGDLPKRLAAADFDAVLLDLNSGTSLARIYAFWHSSSAGFFANLDYTATDEPLEALRAARTDREVQDGLDRVQRTLFRDPPAIFLCWSETTRAVTDRFVVSDPELDLVTTVPRWRLANPREGES